MKGATISILTILVLTMLVYVADSLADEVVFCISHEEENVALMDAKGLCVEGENEYVIEGSGVERSEDLVPLAIFSNNSQHCDENSTGVTTEVGFDRDDNGVLNANEVMISSGSCSH